MEIYKNKSWWKIVLIVVGMLILTVTLVYSNYLANQLKKSEEKNINLYTEALEDFLGNTDLKADMSLVDTILNTFSIPIILENETGELIGNNFGEKNNTNNLFLREKKGEFLNSEKTPIKGNGYSNYIYYFDSPLQNYIRFFPLVQSLMVGMFIILGYYLFNTSRRSEQNRVWAGMAKETAHQLGTPISAILAWIEHLKLSEGVTHEQTQIIGELTKDVSRLELIADRFSKIGSDPKLEHTDLIEELEICKQYMQKRAPRRVKFEFDQPSDKKYVVNINKHLFDWVIENLIRNALDSMDGKGEIGTKIYEEESYVCIDLSDTGKGIAPSKFKAVFQPGFTTKKRGWGLGLSLAKRIIEDYHQGKIFVKNSKLNEGTCFTIKLPKVD